MVTSISLSRIILKRSNSLSSNSVFDRYYIFSFGSFFNIDALEIDDVDLISWFDNNLIDKVGIELDSKCLHFYFVNVDDAIYFKLSFK